MKATKLLSLLTCAAFLLPSCNDVEEAMPVNEHPDYLGYFIGTVNGGVYHLENTKENSDVVRPCTYGWKEDGPLEATWEAVFGKSDVRVWGIVVHIASLRKRTFKPKAEDVMEEGKDWVAIEDDWKGGEHLESTLYYPREESFTVTLENVVYKEDEPERPYIYGRMEGILYNKDNPGDSIIVKDARFGAH